MDLIDDEVKGLIDRNSVRIFEETKEYRTKGRFIGRDSESRTVFTRKGDGIF